MRNLLFIFVLILFAILLIGCGGNDSDLDSVECSSKAAYYYECSENKSYRCLPKDSHFEYVFEQNCDYGCNSNAGLCTCVQTYPSDSGDTLMWSSKVERMSFDKAVGYCENLVENGYNDWRLPNIDALRTLIQNCPNTSPNGKCAVSGECLTTGGYTDDCKTCGASNTLISKLGDSGKFWSSSICSKGCYYSSAWSVDFSTGKVYPEVKQVHWAVKDYIDQNDNVLLDIRCVRNWR